MDWEVELVVVIGKEVRRGLNINKLSYQDYVFGYTIGLDVSARDWQAKNKNGGQILIAKSMDGFLPLGTFMKLIFNTYIKRLILHDGRKL